MRIEEGSAELISLKLNIVIGIVSIAFHVEQIDDEPGSHPFRKQHQAHLHLPRKKWLLLGSCGFGELAALHRAGVLGSTPGRVTQATEGDKPVVVFGYGDGLPVRSNVAKVQSASLATSQ